MKDDTISRAAAIDAICEDGTQRERQGQYSMTMVDRKYRDIEILEALPSAQPVNIAKLQPNCNQVASDCISRQAAIDMLKNRWKKTRNYEGIGDDIAEECELYLKQVPPAQPDSDKYEYHYDHTDCIWYRPEARNRCPVTCAQYRDGWNDAMNYIFRDGQGYRPYRRDERYER